MSQKEIKFDKNTILLTKDVLRADYLSAYNINSSFVTKNIDSLAKKGTLFKNYFSSAPSSGMATTCTFSGLNAYQLDRKTFGSVGQFSQGKTLFNILEENGINTYVLWSEEFKFLSYLHSKVFDERNSFSI